MKITRFQVIPTSNTANANVLKTREKAEEYLSGLVDGGTIRELQIDLGSFVVPLYLVSGGCGNRALANKAGETRIVGTDGQLHPINYGLSGQPLDKAIAKAAIAKRGRKVKAGYSASEWVTVPTESVEEWV